MLIGRIRHFITSESKSIVRASVLMMMLTFLTKIVGLLTKTVAVSRLGTEKYGLFVAANALPELLSTLLILGTITSVIIPILVEVLEKKDTKEFSNLFSSVINSGVIAFSISAILVIIFADKLTPFVIENLASPKEPYSQKEINTIVSMMRWLLAPQIILGVSAIISSALNAYKRFFIPQLAPIFYNFGILFGATFLIPALDGSPWGITWGMLIGAIMHLLIQLPLVKQLKIGYQFKIDFSDDKLKEILVIGLPRVITVAADQIAIAIDKVISIGLGLAAVGAYDLAVRLVSIPFSLFANTFSLAAFPQLAAQYSKGDISGFKRTFTRVFNQILFLTIPITMILLVLRVPLVRLFYGLFGEEFTWENTLMVSWVVFFFSIGLIPEVLGVFLNRAFYAIHDTIRPLIVGIYIVTGGIVTGILFTNYFSHIDTFSLKALTFNLDFFSSKSTGIAAVGGLALSSSLVYSSATVFLIILLSRKIGRLSFKKFYLNIVKKSIYGIIMAGLMYTLFKLWDGVLDTARTINVFILTISTIIPGISIYLWFGYLFEDPEVKIVDKVFSILKNVINK